VPHILGNPVEMDVVMNFAEAHDLYVIEDTCDALGSAFDGKPCGTFSHLATFSFYPAHHITTGEGGAVGTHSDKLRHIAHSVPDWGRDCWCDIHSDSSGECGRYLDWVIPGLDEPYDHRYYYTEIGYNVKMTDVQAAIGIPQIAKAVPLRRQHRSPAGLSQDQPPRCHTADRDRPNSQDRILHRCIPGYG
jgi:CDP-4-dehydro-6-deoxyglucose reductase, E1